MMVSNNYDSSFGSVVVVVVDSNTSRSSFYSISSFIKSRNGDSTCCSRCTSAIYCDISLWEL